MGLAAGKMVMVLVLGLLGLAGAGCAPGGAAQVQEYALIEQSIDSPGSATFAARVPVESAAQQASVSQAVPGGAAQAVIEDSIAFAQPGPGAAPVADGGALLASAPDIQPVNRFTWGQDGEHWAVILADDIVLDGQSLREQYRAEAVFGWQLLDGQPAYFYTRNGTTRLHAAGADQPNRYDAVLHNQDGALAQFNPGGSGTALWFYALRDGLWYYVEAKTS